MGFWRAVGSVAEGTVKLISGAGKLAINTIEESAGQVDELKKEFRDKTNDQLSEIARRKGDSSTVRMERGVARSILRERGLIKNE